MIWQDWALMVGLLGLGIFAIPSIFLKTKPSRFMAISYTTISLSLAVTMTTLGLWLSAGAQCFIALIWGILAVQKRR